MTSDPARWPGRWLSGAPSPAPRSGAGGQGEIAGPALMVRLPVRDEYEAWMSQLPHNIASVTPGAKHSRLPWLIGALRLIGCMRGPPINREAPINRDNQHAYPAKADESGSGGAATRLRTGSWGSCTRSYGRGVPRCPFAVSAQGRARAALPLPQRLPGKILEIPGSTEDQVAPRPPELPSNPDLPRSFGNLVRVTSHSHHRPPPHQAASPARSGSGRSGLDRRLDGQPTHRGRDGTVDAGPSDGTRGPQAAIIEASEPMPRPVRREVYRVGPDVPAGAAAHPGRRFPGWVSR
jgi:hypothetical protein